MGCTNLDDDLVPFHFGTLAPDARERMEAHLLRCPDCLRSYLHVKRSVEDSPGTFAQRPSAAARARLRATVEATFAAQKPTNRASARLGWASAGAAAAAIVMAIVSPHFRESTVTPTTETAETPAPRVQTVNDSNVVREQVDTARLALAEPQFL